MKRRLLFLTAFVLSCFGLRAYEFGDYYYSESAKWWILSENLMKHGNFSCALSDLKNDVGGAVTSEYFAIVAEGAPNGADNCLEVVQSGASGTGGSLLLSAELPDSGSYLLTYKVRSGGGERTMSTWYMSGENSQIAYVNRDGSTTVDTDSGDVWISPDRYGFHYGKDWKEFSYVFTVKDSSYVSLRMFGLVEGDRIADAGVYKLRQVGDDRLARRLLARIDECLGNKEDYPNDDGGSLASVRGMLADAISNPKQMESPLVVADMIRDIEDNYLIPFLDANTVDVSRYFRNFFFKYEKGAGYGNIDGWNVPKGYFYFRETPALPDCSFDTDHLRQYIHPNSVVVNLPPADVRQTLDLPAGRYMYRVKAAGSFIGYGASLSSYVYTKVLSDSVHGMSFFINSDTLVMEHISPTWAKEYTLYGTVREGERMTVGLHSPGDMYKQYGFEYRWDNLEIRLLGGKTQEYVETFLYGVELGKVKAGLTELADSARALTDMYLYGKDELRKAISDTESLIASVTAPEQASVDILDRQREALESAIAAYYETNAEYSALGEAIAMAEGYLADGKYANGKAALSSAVETARSYYASLTSAYRDVAGMNEAADRLKRAVIVFLTANGNHATPADVTMLIVNPYFADKGNGWDVSENAANTWKYGYDANFINGTSIYSEGNLDRSLPNNSVLQTITLENTGLYELSFQASSHARGRFDDRLAEPNGVFFVTTLNGRTDSLIIHTPYKNDAGETGVPQTFTARVIVESAPAELTFGIDALNNGELLYELFARSYSYGGNRLVYYGDYDKYLRDSVAAAIAPVRDSLLSAADSAMTLKSEARHTDGIDMTPLQAAIDAARAVAEDIGSSGDDITAQFPLLTSAVRSFTVSGAWPAKGKSYDVSFMIENADFSDPRGTFYGWRLSGERFGTGSGGMLSLYYADIFEKSSGITQSVSGLPPGRYQFRMSATYRKGKPEWFDPYDYADNPYMSLTGNGESSPVYGLLADGGWPDIDGESWIYPDGQRMSLDDYRGSVPASSLFDAGYFLGGVEFSVGSDSTAQVGVSVTDIPVSSFVYARGPRLFFWGDKVVDGIDSVPGAATVCPESGVFTLSGVRVRSGGSSLSGLPKGIYIVNGRKYVVR